MVTAAQNEFNTVIPNPCCVVKSTYEQGTEYVDGIGTPSWHTGVVFVQENVMSNVPVLGLHLSATVIVQNSNEQSGAINHRRRSHVWLIACSFVAFLNAIL